MGETYVECLVKAKQSTPAKVLKVFLVALTALMVVAMMILPVTLIVAIITGVAAYFVNLYSDLEYEYLYIDRELVIDKVMAKSKRKRVAVYNIDRMEIFAPIKSYHLDSYRNRNANEKDYSVGEELKPDLRYVMYYEGGEKIILNPSEDMVKAIRNIAPRKVFTD